MKLSKTLLALTATMLMATPALAIDAKKRVEDKSISVDNVWKIVGDFCGIASWHPAVEKCDLSEQDGAKIRTLTLKGGAGTVVEKLTEWDDAGHKYTYTILDAGPLPVANYTSTLSTKADDDGGAGIKWVGTFDAKEGVSDADALAAIEGVYDGGLNAILEKAKGM